jgi:hypothetical protein
MATTQIGTDALIGASYTGLPNGTDYIVESVTINDAEIDMEDIFDGADGARALRLIFNKFAKVKLSLLCKAGAAPLTDYPAETVITIDGAATWFVNSAPVTKTKSPWRVEVDLTNYGLAAIA